VGSSGRGPGSSEKKGRAYLLLSLILLIWNTAAAARHEFAAFPPPEPVPADRFTPSNNSSENPSAPVARFSARLGPLSLRQKYFLGKRVDINKATAGEISELPGISDKVAAAVVEERTRRGRFRSPRDLLSVPGIKEKRLEKILPFLAKMENN